MLSHLTMKSYFVGSQQNFLVAKILISTHDSTDSKTRVFHAGILLILVTHRTSSYSYWNFDSSFLEEESFSLWNFDSNL